MKRINIVILTIASVALLMLSCVSNQPPPPIGRQYNSRYLSPGQLQAVCEKHGGTYSAPDPVRGGAYYCLLPDGGRIACGGGQPCRYEPPAAAKPPPFFHGYPTGR
jgi:hypothetical protein